MNKERIMARMQEHLATVQEHFGDAWVGLFLQGSQNYKLDYESSDIDTKAIVLPSFSDFVLTHKPVSTTHVMENDEHVDFKDIRLMFECIRKQTSISLRFCSRPTALSTRSTPICFNRCWTPEKILPAITTMLV